MERKEMLPSGSTTPVGGNQNVSQPALHRTNSGLLAGGGQGGGVGVGATSQGFPALISPRSQYCNVNSMLGNLPSVPVAGGNFNSIGMTQAFSNCGNVASQSNTPNVAGVVPNRALAMADSLPISGVGGGMNILGSSGTMNVTLSRPGGGSVAPVTPNGHHYSNSSPQVPQDQQQQGQQTQLQQQQQQLEQQKFQQGQQQQHPQDIVSGLQGPGQSILGKRTFQQIQGQHLLGIGGNQQQQLQPYRSFPSDQQQLQLRNLAPMKLDPQQIRNLTSVKLEHPGEQSLLLPQQQQLLQFSRQPPQQIQIQAAAAAAQMSMLQQQRMLQQQQLLNAFPQSRSQLQQQNMPVALPQKSPVYESGMCARRLMQYMFHQQHRPEDNNIDFWRKFVSEYFAPHAKKRWCFALYGSGRQTTGVFPQDVWHCEICGAKPGKGFETTVEVLPRLSKIKYDSGTMEELLYVDMPKERATSSGHIVLEYGKAIQESVFEQLRVVRDGQLRIVFSSDLKICSWEFCARGHEDLIPRKLLVPQVSQLGAIAQKYQSSIQNGSSTNLSTQELQTNCNMFVATARQLAKTLEVPLVNDLGYTKRYVRCLQISEVVDSMKDLIDFSQENKIGPLESLQRFPRRTTNTGTRQNQATQQQEPNAGTNAMINASNSQHLTVSNEQNAGQTTITQNAGTNPMSHSTNSVSLVSHANSSNAMVGVIHQNSMNNRTNSSTSFTSSVQVPSVSSVPVQQSQVSSSSSVPNSSSSISNTQVSPPSTITSTSSQLPSVSGSTNLLQQQSVATGDLDQADPDGSVPYFIQEIMMSSQLNGGSAFQSSIGGTAVGNGVCNDVKPLQVTGTANGSVGLKSATGFGMNGFSNNANIEFNNVGAIDSIPSSLNGIRHNMAITRNNVTLNGRTTGASLPQNLTIQDSNLNLQDFGGNRLLNGLSSPNNFNNLQFDWKPS